MLDRIFVLAQLHFRTAKIVGRILQPLLFL